MAEFKELKCQIRDIKSSYIIKGIFLFLNERQKLNIIIYNKQLQKILGYNYEGKEEFEINHGEGNVKEYNYKGKFKIRLATISEFFGFFVSII